MKNGFTLAEVVITLGIVGVIAALTIPQLMANINNVRNTAMLKQDYALLSQALLKANDAGAFSTLEAGNDITEMKHWFEEYIQPVLKTTQVCYDESGCWADGARQANGKVFSSTGKGCGAVTISFILPNGSYVCFDDYFGGHEAMNQTYGINPMNAYYMAINIDVNGKNPPNIYGKDIFVMIFHSATDEYIPAGDDKTEEQVDANCRLSSSGIWCMAKAKRQNFKLPVMP